MKVHHIMWQENTVEANAVCIKCGFLTEAEIYVVNFGWCDNCFDESLDEYYESISGPFDWIVK
jgi:Zn ribbon nucleic-acid-binding protein